MVEEIRRLEKAVSKLELKDRRRSDFNRSVVNFLNSFIDDIDQAKGFENDFSSADEIFNIPFSDKGYPIEDILQLFDKAVISNGIQAASGNHIGYIPGGGVPVAAYGDFIAAMTNKYSGIYYASPGAVNIENHLLNWFADLFGFNKNTFGGNLTTGGSIANLIAIVAARDKHEIRGKDFCKTVIYGSEQMHHCLHKAIRISGLGECIFRNISLDNTYHIDINTLEHQLEKDSLNGLQPFLIIGSAGTTDTGVIDDLEALKKLADLYSCWFHVDAAYGGFFYMLEECKEKHPGIDLADSLVIDPHKGLFLPYGSGAVLVKDKEDLLLNTNEFVNKYYKDLYKHEELMWKLFCLTSTGKNQFHEYIKPPNSRVKTDNVSQFVSRLYPHMKGDEIDLFRTLNSDDDIKQMAKDTGITDKEFDEIFGKTKKRKNK